MWKFSCLILFVVFAYARLEVINVNEQFEVTLEASNEEIRKRWSTTEQLGSGRIANVSWTNGLIIGLDSMMATGNSLLITHGSNATYDLYFGYRLYGVTFDKLTINGEAMSGFLRVRNNTMQVTFTVHNETNCYVTLDAKRWLTLTDVEFVSSRPEFNSLDVNYFFQEYVLPLFNRAQEAQRRNPSYVKIFQQYCTYPLFDNFSASHVNKFLL